MTIKEASERLGIPPSTIRFYERKGLLPDLKRDVTGNRIFEQNSLNWINLLIYLRATGMSITNLQQFTSLAVQGKSTIPQRQALLEEYKLELQRKQEVLTKALAAVNQKLEYYRVYSLIP